MQKHIVDYIFSQGWEGFQAEIFMGLKDGTLKNLLLDPHLAQVPDRDERVAKLVIRHMLQALDFLPVHGIVHRDVKPENILYTRTSGVNEDECLFQLGDFGLSNRQSVAKSVAGTEIYVAPEVKRGWAKQTSKADVWSLFVTVLWVLNANFRQFAQTNSLVYERVLVAVQAATALDRLQEIREMARVDPEARASAAHIHLRLSGHRGLQLPGFLRSSLNRRSGQVRLPSRRSRRQPTSRGNGLLLPHLQTMRRGRLALDGRLLGKVRPRTHSV